jgi:DNA-binding NtrC family response regulator
MVAASPAVVNCHIGAAERPAQHLIDMHSPSPSCAPSSSRGTDALVVEDDNVLRAVICATLHDVGYDSRAASSVDEARAALSRRRPDVVVFDLMLGLEFGEQLLLELLDCENRPAVVICSGFALAHLVAARHDVGFMRKPFDLERLVSLVEDAVEQRGSGAQARDRRPTWT